MQVSKHQPRHRSATLDPFNDPSNVSYSAYGVPTLPRNAPISSRLPPPPPPKPPSKHHSYRQYPSSTSHRDNIMDAVQDVVTVRGSTDHAPRTRVGRSQTELPHPTTRPPPPSTSKRSQSQDSVARAANVMEKSKKSKSKGKTSAYADVIDKLDYSGVGPALFHHDGPFDACAPSRNRHRTKAPMAAWSVGQMADEAALAGAQQIQPRSPDVFIPYEAPKKVDAIAEAWGVHEPEPFEEFAWAGTPTVDHGEGYRGSTNGKRSNANRNMRDVYRDFLEGNNADGGAPRRANRPNVPPPMPIFPQGELASADPPSPTSAAGAETPRRNKSIMQRIRKMRDSPNVPVPNEDEGRRDLSPSEIFGAMHFPPSPSRGPARITHRSQGSFVGRFGRAANTATTPTDDAFVYVDHVPMKKDKSLPTPPKSTSPQEAPVDGYFDGAEAAPGGGGGLGRKTSLLKKVGGVVKGRRN